MRIKGFKILLSFLLIIINLNFINAQNQIVELKSEYNSLGKFWVGTFEGGLTLPFNDFQTPAIGYSAHAGLEYYFPSSSFFTFGLRLFGAYGELNGESVKGRLSGDGSLKRIVKKFNTPFVLIGPSFLFAFGKRNIIPYLSTGVDYFFSFIPLETNSYSLYLNSKRNSFITYSGEFGIRYFIQNNFSYNISVKYFNGSNDELDGYISRKNDSFLL